MDSNRSGIKLGALHIASLTNLVDRACYLAITTGVETITADLLAAATADNAAQTSSQTR